MTVWQWGILLNGTLALIMHVAGVEPRNNYNLYTGLLCFAMALTEG